IAHARTVVVDRLASRRLRHLLDVVAVVGADRIERTRHHRDQQLCLCQRNGLARPSEVIERRAIDEAYGVAFDRSEAWTVRGPYAAPLHGALPFAGASCNATSGAAGSCPAGAYPARVPGCRWLPPASGPDAIPSAAGRRRRCRLCRVPRTAR